MYSTGLLYMYKNYKIIRNCKLFLHRGIVLQILATYQCISDSSRMSLGWKIHHSFV